MHAPSDPSPWLYLASASPRRRRLLLEHGIPHIAEAPPLDDGTLDPGDADPARWVAALAYLKAAAALRRLDREGRGPYVILGADTIVVKAGRIIGQPSDAEHARSILMALAGGEHSVLTGVALLTPQGHVASPLARGRSIFTDRATVCVGAIEPAEIDNYVASGQWRGKAGAYNLAERVEAGWPLTYEGDAGTIMGLPMRRLAPLLHRFAPSAPRCPEGAEP